MNRLPSIIVGWVIVTALTNDATFFVLFFSHSISSAFYQTSENKMPEWGDWIYDCDDSSLFTTTNLIQCHLINCLSISKKICLRWTKRQPPEYLSSVICISYIRPKIRSFKINTTNTEENQLTEIDDFVNVSHAITCSFNTRPMACISAQSWKWSDPIHLTTNLPTKLLEINRTNEWNECLKHTKHKGNYHNLMMTFLVD